MAPCACCFFVVIVLCIFAFHLPFCATYFTFFSLFIYEHIAVSFNVSYVTPSNQFPLKIHSKRNINIHLTDIQHIFPSLFLVLSFYHLCLSLSLTMNTHRYWAIDTDTDTRKRFHIVSCCCTPLSLLLHNSTVRKPSFLLRINVLMFMLLLLLVFFRLFVYVFVFSRMLI